MQQGVVISSDLPVPREFRSDEESISPSSMAKHGECDACHSRSAVIREQHCGQKFRLSCHKHALRTFIHSFSISFGLRASLSLLLRVFQLARSRPLALLSLKELVAEGGLTYREDAVRLGLFTGLFFGGYSYLHCLLQGYRGPKSSNSLIAGALAGLSILIQPHASRRTLALYIFARLLQCLYNELRLQGYIKPLKHGDALLFILSSAQIMYAYVIRPSTLPTSFWKWIVKTGPIDERVLTAVRNNCRHQPFDPAPIAQYLGSFAPTKAAAVLPDTLNTFPPAVPCSILHPQQDRCSVNVLRVFYDAFRRVFPLYASLTFLPLVAYRSVSLLRSPLRKSGTALLSAARSTSFLASFVALYQATVCSSRNLFTKDHRILYFISGIVSSLSIFIERKERRSELALYTMPRAVDSLFTLLCDRKLMASMPYGEVLLFCISMSGLMYFFHGAGHGGRSMSPLLNTIFKWHFAKQKML